MLTQSETFSGDDFKAEEYLDKLLSQKKFDFSNVEKCSESFEQMSQLLAQLNEELDNRKLKLQNELETSIKISEINLENKQSVKDQVQKEFNELKLLYAKIEQNLDTLGSDLNNPSEKLSRLELERSEIEMTQELLEHFISFNSVNYQEHPTLYTSRVPLQKSAMQLYVLNKVAETIKVEEYANAKKHISRTYSDMQSYLINEFREAFWRLNISRIKELLPLIEQYEMISKTVLFYIDQTLSDLKINLSSASSSMIQQDLQMIYDQIYQAYEKSLSIVNSQTGEKNYFSLTEIFQSYAPSMLQQFISYTFNSIIQPMLVQMLSSQANIKQYLQNYAMLYQLTFNLVQQIQGIKHSLQRVNLKEISNSYFQSIYQEYSITYQEKEYQWLSDEIETNVAKILQDIGTRKRDHTMEQEKLSKEEITRRLSLMEQILHQENIERIYAAIQQSLQRNDIVNKGEIRVKLKVRLMEKFLQSFADNLLRNLVDQQLNNHFIQQAPHQQFQGQIEKLNQMLISLRLFPNQTHWCREWISSKDWTEHQVLQDLNQKKENLLKSLEILINKAIQLALASIFINQQKGLHKKGCWNIERCSIVVDIILNKSTIACQEFLAFLNTYMQKIKKFSSSQIRQGILSSISEQIITILVEHYSNFQVSLTGSFQLSIDISNYRKLFFEFENEHILREFEVLEVLTNLFKVSNNQLKKYIEEEPLFKTLSQEVIQRYITKRVEKE